LVSAVVNFLSRAYASQPHRAGARVVLAELGSLSVEFTRLAQITKEMKYYDAIARVTDELEKWQQHTKLPGMWPISVDASGCKKPEVNMAQIEHSSLNGPQDPLPQIPAQALPYRQPLEESASSPRQGDSPQTPKSQAGTGSGPDKEMTPDEGFSKGKIQNWEKMSIDPGTERKSGAMQERNPSPDVIHPLRRRQLDDSALNNVPGAVQGGAKQPTDGENGNIEKAECEPQGLYSPPYAKLETFTLGGQSDSTYEYLPKEYMLLGGLQEQYRSMYENAMATVRKYLLFRPMTQNRRNVLVSGKVKTRGHPDAIGDVPSDLEMTFESTHLTCFAGGMFAIGAKIFGIEGDMDIASKLTDGCVWAYESTQTGIMPEGFELIACENSKSCEWNETLWWDRLDPMRKYREQQWQDQETYRQKPVDALPPKATTSPKVASGVNTIYSDDPNRISTEKENTSGTESNANSGAGSGPLVKRQEISPGLSGSADTAVKKTVDPDEPGKEQPSKTSPEELRSDEEPATNYNGGMPLEDIKFPKPLFTPPRMPTHEEYVKARITEERIPPGFTEIFSRKYILR
jgi:mannosyl-oligosaccharide alpha-1,2-mannosidase